MFPFERVNIYSIQCRCVIAVSCLDNQQSRKVTDNEQLEVDSVKSEERNEENDIEQEEEEERNIPQEDELHIDELHVAKGKIETTPLDNQSTYTETEHNESQPELLNETREEEEEDEKGDEEIEVISPVVKDEGASSNETEEDIVTFEEFKSRASQDTSTTNPLPVQGKRETYTLPLKLLKVFSTCSPSLSYLINVCSQGTNIVS